ncbi:MAG: DUF4388 domain-containing protein [Nitrospirota bacterium]
MALEGSLKDFGLADILQLIHFQRKTGVLLLEGRMDRVRLLFVEGNIVGAESKRRREANRLGTVLVKKGFIREEELRSVLEEQKGSDMKLGDILVKKGFVEKDQIQDILTGQIKETVVQVFGWKEGTYEFTPQEVPVDKEFFISLNTHHLLMEGLRIVDEWSVVEGKLTLDTVFEKRAAVVPDLTDVEREIFPLVDGENDVSTIIDISAMDDFEVSKTLVSLMERGVIETKESAPVIAEAPSVEIKKTATFHYLLPILAIVISSLLSLFPLFSRSENFSKRLSAAKTIEDLRFAVEAYKFEHGSYPGKFSLITERADPWGRPYIYKQSGDTFTIMSSGPDSKEGTSDDIY